MAHPLCRRARRHDRESGRQSRRGESWQWQCGFYPGSEPGEHRSGSAPSFEAARAAFGAAWRPYLANRTEADFQAWRDQQAWTSEKYARFDRGERMPADWRPHG